MVLSPFLPRPGRPCRQVCTAHQGFLCLCGEPAAAIAIRERRGPLVNEYFWLACVNVGPWPRFAFSAEIVQWRSTTEQIQGQALPPFRSAPSRVCVGGSRHEEMSTGEKQSTLDRFMHSSPKASQSRRPSSLRNLTVALIAVAPCQRNTRSTKALICLSVALGFWFIRSEIPSLFPVCQSTWPSRHRNPVVNRAASRRTIDPIAFITSSQP